MPKTLFKSEYFKYNNLFNIICQMAYVNVELFLGLHKF